jgi:putative Mg2+ transporter-C (MgtC) family protein
VPDLSTTEALLRLLLAAALGGAIGLEREMRDHEAGFRTHLLVSLGSCAFTLISSHGWSDWTFSNTSGVVFDPTRIAAQIVTGIGFLGAGAIIVRGINVRGLTTAATLWVVAAIGMASGTGYYVVAIGAAVLVLVSLGPLKFVSARFISRVRPEEAELVIALKPDGDGARVLARIEELGAQASAVEFGDDRQMNVVLRPSRRSESARVAELLAKLEGVERVQWRP